MKKVLIVFVMSIAVCAQANIYVNWGASSGFYALGGGATSYFTLGSGSTALAQLIWSADAVADTASADTANYVTGDDVWLADYTLVEGGGASEWATFTPDTFDDGGTSGLSGGFLYARIFQDSSVDNSDYYYWGPLVATLDINPGIPANPSLAQDVEINRDDRFGFGDAFDQGGTGASTVMPVPEPATMALFALGLATLGISRKRKTRA